MMFVIFGVMGDLIYCLLVFVLINMIWLGLVGDDLIVFGVGIDKGGEDVLWILFDCFGVKVGGEGFVEKGVVW